jgi:hypothetical protein
MSNNSPKLPDILDAFHQEHWYLTKLLVLLSIIAIASVGSFSLAQHLLPQGPPVTTTPVPTYSDGVCNADPSQMQSKYIPLDIAPSSVKHANSSVDTNMSTISSRTPTPKSNRKPIPAPTQMPTPTPIVPDNWYTYGFTDDDAKYAEACAAQFVLDYHTFDASNLASLETPTSMLSAHAKKLFYLGGTEDTHHIHLHMLAQWQNTIQKLKQNQQATVQQPTLSHITPQYANYIVEMDVGYKLVKEINFGVQPPEIHHDTVILQNTSPSPKLLPNEQHGWEVVDWIDADV